MPVEMQIEMGIYRIDDSQPIDIAMPLEFKGSHLKVHNVLPPHATILVEEGMIGNVSRGGSCNWEEYSLIPHSHGTHTECLGHITSTPINVHDVLKQLLIPATLISVMPTKGKASDETYFPFKKDDDLIITREALEEALRWGSRGFCEALVVRTLPNNITKLSRDYQNEPSPFFSSEAMEYLISYGVKHLLVDFPSVDRMHDEGYLQNHRLFWNMPLGSTYPAHEVRLDQTITELIYVPTAVLDGQYVLNLQIPCFAADAAPSRPLLFPIKKIS